MADVEMVIDMQEWYLNGSHARVNELISRICHRLELAMDNRRPIILVKYWRSDGTAYLDGGLVKPVAGAVAWYDHIWSLGKDRDGLLHSSWLLRQKALDVLERFRHDRIWLSWVNANFCVLDTGISLHEAWFSPTVLSTCIANICSDELDNRRAILRAYKKRWATHLIDQHDWFGESPGVMSRARKIFAGMFWML